MVRVSVINALTAAATPVNPVTLQVFVSAAEDYQIAIPFLKGTKPPASVWKAQMMTSNTFMDTPTDYKPDQPCTYPSMSMRCLKQLSHPLIGPGVKYTNVNYSTPCTLNYVRDYTNQLAWYADVNYTPTETNKTLEVVLNPNGVCFGEQNGPGSFLDFMKTCFHYWRGGLRMAIVGQGGFVASADTLCDTKDVSVTGPMISQSMIIGSPGTSLLGWTNSALNPRSDDMPLDYTVPYASTVRAQTTQCFASSSQLEGVPRLVVRLAPQVNTTPTINNMVIMLGGGDDFILGWQLPSPQIAQSTLPGETRAMLARQVSLIASSDEDPDSWDAIDPGRDEEEQRLLPKQDFLKNDIAVHQHAPPGTHRGGVARSTNPEN